MNPRSARAIYSAVLRLATPLYLLRLLWRSRKEPLYRHQLAQRLALAGAAGAGVPEPKPAPVRAGFDASAGARIAAPPTGRLWIHAVSLGETRAAAALITALREQSPSLRLLLTHSTATGFEAGGALLREGDAQTWLPYDTPGAVRRFLAAQRPSAGVLLETEVWPNLVHEAQSARVPLVLANARLSQRSLEKAQRFKSLMQPAAAALSAVLAQTDADAQRLRQAGANAEAVQVLGNIKFDMAPSPAQQAQGPRWRQALGRPVVLAASMREGEEALLLEAWVAQQKARPDPSHLLVEPLLVIVPRHPQRFDEVAHLVEQRGLRLARRSTWTSQANEATPGPAWPAAAARAQVWLGDSMGEMALYFSMADVALLGGSFAPLGGQNLIEAAACGCPVVMGPHTFNFAQAAELALEAGAAQRVPDMAAGVQAAWVVAGHAGTSTHQALKQRALGFAGAHKGAAQRMAQVVLQWANALG